MDDILIRDWECLRALAQRRHVETKSEIQSVIPIRSILFSQLIDNTVALTLYGQVEFVFHFDSRTRAEKAYVMVREALANRPST